MSDIDHQHDRYDAEPLPGTHLRVGSPTDQLNFLRTGESWVYWHNGDNPRPCDYTLVEYWAPLFVVSQPRPRFPLDTTPYRKARHG